METCSNCGATNRESAKFCTSCGVRLPTLARSTATDWDRSERETTTAATATTVESSSTAPETDASPSATDDSDGATQGNADARPIWSWNEPTTSDARGTDAPANDADGQEAAADDISGQATGDDTDASTGGSASDTSSTLSHWASQWTGEYASAPEADVTRGTSGDLPAAEAAPEDGQANDGATPAVGDDEAAKRYADEVAWQAAIAEPVDVPSDDLDTTAATQSGDSSIAGTEIESPSAPADADEEAETSPAPVTGDHSVSLARARELLDELQSLLPQLASPAASAPAASAGRERAEGVGSDGTTQMVAQELAAARAEGFDTADLRRSLEAAHGRPRDVDTMLDLVGRVEPMLAALDAHDRLTAAVDRALSQLGQPGGEASSGAMQGQEPDQQPGDSSFSWRRH